MTMITLQLLQIVLLFIVLLLLMGPNRLRQRNTKTKGERAIVLDTCALIDGRIEDLVQTGFIDCPLIIPQFVIDELQFLADGQDSQKRARARFGLDVAHNLQQNQLGVRVVLHHDTISEASETDAKLVKLAMKEQALLYTTDYNLNKVAKISGVKVLNVHELAGALRVVALPGETRQIKIIQKGSAKGQGVGYLEDGTMVVVDNAANKIGEKIIVTITRVHQTDAGKMIFGTHGNSPTTSKRRVAASSKAA